MRVGAVGVVVMVVAIGVGAGAGVVGAEEEGMFTEFSQVSPTAVYVVEVFTSQGCSSCPPADDNVSLLYDQAREAGLELYVLAWHVDYWNRLGWVDPYSSAVSTKRQRDYARHRRRSTVYTPQVMINGHVEVSSAYRGDAFLAALRRAGRSQERVYFDLRANVEGGEIEVAYTQRGSAPETALRSSGYEIGALLVEGGIVTQPTRGENRGRRLTNNHVVRASRFGRLRREDRIALDLPSDINLARSKVIVVAQNNRTHEMVFAGAVEL